MLRAWCIKPLFAEVLIINRDNKNKKVFSLVGIIYKKNDPYQDSNPVNYKSSTSGSDAPPEEFARM